MQLSLFQAPVPKAVLPDSRSALECAANQALLMLFDGPLEFVHLVDEIKGSEAFRHKHDWLKTSELSRLLEGLERKGRLSVSRRYFGSRSPAEGNYQGFTHIYSLPAGNSGETHGDHNH